MSNYPGLKRRGKKGIYQVRVAVPSDLQGGIGRKEVTVSLRTADFEKAVDRYFVEVGKIRAGFKTCRNNSTGEFSFKSVFEENPIQPRSLLQLTQKPLAGPLLSQAFEAWFSSPETRKWKANTARDTQVALNHFLKARGDRPLCSYEKKDAREFKVLVQDLPPRWNLLKIFRGMSLVDIAKKARSMGMTRQANSTLRRNLGFIGAFFKWAEKNYDEVPHGLAPIFTIPKEGNARAERSPFTLEELTAIFHAPTYTGFISARHRHKPGPNIMRDCANYWVPLIALFTGMRLYEIVQLYVEDVVAVELVEGGSVYCFDINKEGEDKTLKTPTSKRQIPVHKILMDLGVMSYADKMKRAGSKRLFPDVPQAKSDGTYSSTFSKRFRHFLDNLGIKHKKISFHSFRHSFEDACRDSSVTQEITDALQGHAQRGMAGRYGNGFSLEVLSEAMERFQYRGLDLSHLTSRAVISCRRHDSHKS
ncbi:site-specific integrase [Paucidesulfovibrio longus]|uniref:site-specific integrase n=1 Tax=Paucidesulfovibrio longus TaxID=889 RepID=UPI0004069221|nr:site-specific integrase [Paucidesulfovibrio longus]